MPYSCESTTNRKLNYIKFDVHVTVHRCKFLIIKPTICTSFSNLFLEWNSTCFGPFLCPSSGVFHCSHNNGICHKGLLTACEQKQDGTAVPSWSCSQAVSKMTYTIAVCTVKNSWWWTDELFETRRVSFQNKFEKLVHLVGLLQEMNYISRVQILTSFALMCIVHDKGRSGVAFLADCW